jgi:hypothetical protein
VPDGTPGGAERRWRQASIRTSSIACPDVLDGIDGLLDRLAANGNVTERIEVITVALSPGFFPSEFWARSAEHLDRRLSQLMGSRLRR